LDDPSTAKRLVDGPAVLELARGSSSSVEKKYNDILLNLKIIVDGIKTLPDDSSDVLSSSKDECSLLSFDSTSCMGKKY